MSNLIISQAKPNPSGKDRYKQFTPPTELVGEWVDIFNQTYQSIDLSSYSLYHKAYKPDGTSEFAIVTRLSGILLGRSIARVHSGDFMTQNSMPEIDRIGANIHLFTGKNYVWNNNKEDTPLIYNAVTKTTIDKATYDAFPPDGVILKRYGDRLIIA
ncbi:lamin tail domain-containing protein [Candidatus Roizmanbacteria bacterium]|nr:lamin tail domain-containing protein [Candidatus Roizmanbacteria bacterium]